MKITSKGPGDADLSHAVQNDKKVGSVGADKDAKTQASGKTDKVEISAQARKLQRIAELAAKGDELRAEKVRVVKQQIDDGEYHVSADEVAKSIVRSDVSELLKKK